VGGFELEAAEAVCQSDAVGPLDVADLLGSLVNKSLVVSERSSGSLRYRLLETIRQYAADQLARTTGEAGTRQAQRAHAEFYLQLAETAAPELARGPRQGLWLKRTDLERDNHRASLAYLFAEPNRTEEVLRFGVALHRFFGSRGHLDAIAHVRAALERQDPVSAALRVRALCVTSDLVAYTLGVEDRAEMSSAIELCEQALEMARELDDPALLAEALGTLSVWVDSEEDSSRKISLAEEALEVGRSTGDPWLIGRAFQGLGGTAPTPDDEQALALEGLAYFRQAGDIYYAIPQLWCLARLETNKGELAAARILYEDAIAAAEDIGSPIDLNYSWNSLCFVLLLLEKFEEAALVSCKSLVGGRRLGHRRVVAFAIFVLACCAAGLGEHRRAAQLTGSHDAIEADIIGVGGAYSLTPLEQRVWEDNTARLREFLGKGEFVRAYGIGRGLTFDQAVDLALGRVHAI
jgi:tetratricopeptide (TPR) repeat protein